MVFSSTIFIFYFLPAVLFFYFIVKNKLRNMVLLLASLFFYAWGEPGFILILVLSILLNYLVGLGIDKFRYRAVSKGILAGGIAANSGILFFYKYINFSISILNGISGELFGWEGIQPLSVALPIGLSFFTFQGLSYVIDVYRQTVPVQKNPFHIALYISMFPQLVAGPIVRYEDICRELDVRTTALEDAASGTQRFIIGLAKKVMIADVLAFTSDKIFGLDLGQLTPVLAWVGAICYTFQIYFDFSGYSDMAIGLGRIFGFHFSENFNLPYSSLSITEFWRRWHISLSTWFRDYLYIPMGGNRRGNVYFHLIIVFLCTGLWHGAAFTFVFWGLWHGGFLLLERLGKLKRWPVSLPRLVRWIYTSLVVVCGWVFFRSPTLSYAGGFLRVMAGYSTPDFKWYGVAYYLDLQIAFTITAAFLLSLGIPQKIAGCQKLYGMSKPCKISILYEYLKAPALWFLLLCCICMIVNGNYSPFIYFRF